MSVMLNLFRHLNMLIVMGWCGGLPNIPAGVWCSSKELHHAPFFTLAYFTGASTEALWRKLTGLSAGPLKARSF